MKKLNLKTLGAIGAAGALALSVAGIRAVAFAQAPNPGSQSQSQSATVTANEDVTTGAGGDLIDQQAKPQVSDQTTADGTVETVETVETTETTGADVQTSTTDTLTDTVNLEQQAGDQLGGVDSVSTAGN